MKKIFILTLLTLALNAHYCSALTPEEVRSERYLKNHGHSDEMVRLVDLNHAHTNGKPATYKSKDPKWYSFKPVKYVRKIFMYLDPGLDDKNQSFGDGDIHYTNRWDDI